MVTGTRHTIAAVSTTTRRGAPEARDDVATVMAFVNTLTGRGTAAAAEKLQSYEALLDWARTAGVISAAAAAELRRAAEAHPHEAGRVLTGARAMRESLHALFAAVAQGKSPPSAVLGELAACLGAGYAQARLVFQDGALQWAPGPVARLADVTHELARAAARLVESPALSRVRACDADDCRWWFVDDTRNHSRRWCEMKTCGNRAKLRRYRARA
jgi:predicted RNA-binding Zn ribbon-like protein